MRPTLCGTTLVLTDFNNRPIIASSQTCFISRLLYPQVGHRYALIKTQCYMYKFINTRHVRKGAVGEMRHILLVHVKHHTKRGVQFAIARDHLRDELTLCH